MTKVAYLDCPTGISGDMCLGALVDAGVPLAYLSEKLSQLGLSQEYCLQAELVQRQGQQATQVHVVLSSPDSEATSAQLQRSHLAPRSPSPNSAGTDTETPDTPKQIDHSHPAHGHPHPAHGHPHPAHNPDPHSPDPHSPDPDHHPARHHTPAHQPVIHRHASQHHVATSAQQVHSHSRHLPEIERLILTAHLPDRVTRSSLAIFRRLAEAEAAVHGIPPQQVHFHEVGATDAIVDIVGTCLGLDWLGVEQLYCSALPVGGGTVWAAHGRLPVPAPAVLKLFEMAQVPLYSNQIQQELVTPTGAAIATTLAVGFGAPPPMRLQKVGLGAGSKDLPTPNILRLWLGTEFTPGTATATAAHPIPISASPTPARLTQETIAVLETQIDDLSPQAIGYTMTELFAAGALDVFTQAIGMKKSRPAILLTVICPPELVSTCETILFRETTTLGIRRSDQQRTVLDRSFETVTTPLGDIRIKIARATNTLINAQPEFEDCAALARQHHLPWKEIHRLALQTWHAQSHETTSVQ